MGRPAEKLSTRTDEALLDWMQLARSENVGPLTFHRLIERYKTPGEALRALPELAFKGGLKRSLKVASRSSVEAELQSVEAFGAHVVTCDDPFYPALLRHIDSAPPLLTLKGKLEILQSPLFAIVGARNASATGKKMAHQFARQLGEHGWGIVSGLARGIDGAAHQGSLDQGTVAVLAGGIDQIYPPENEALYHEIAQKGVLVAESPFGVQPQSILFPKRNRIVSGVSRCVLVVEAALKSGSLITAKNALEQGREVFAIPGHPLDPRARGCNSLIKNGAVLVETLEDIIRDINPSMPLLLQEKIICLREDPSSSSSEEIRRLLNENLSYIPINVDELIRECHLSPSDVWTTLLEMEIAGRIERLPGGKVVLKEEWKEQ